MSLQSVVKGKRNQLKAQSPSPAHGVGPTQAPQSLISEALGVSSPGAKCQPEGKLGSLTQPHLETHLNSKKYRCPRVAIYIHELICSPTEHPPPRPLPRARHCAGRRVRGENERHCASPNTAFKAAFLLLGTLISPPANSLFGYT